MERSELLAISKDIRDVVSIKQKELELSFIEETHTYYMRDSDGVVKTSFPSVSTVIKQFYDDFPSLDMSFKISNGDILAQDKLLKEWRGTADYANNKGSRVHYLLEMDLLDQYGAYKEVRKPIFECDEDQIKDGNAMIDGGHNFIRLMHRRGAVLLDTEMVLGSPKLGYTGQPDKVWIMHDKNGDLGLLVTDWKTNKPKNFKVHHYTSQMLTPFEHWPDTALSHYKIQLPLYGRLLLDMLKGTKYEGIKLLGCIIVHLESNGVYTEYRVEKKFTNIVMGMDPLPRIEEVFEGKKLFESRDKDRLDMVQKELEDRGYID